MKTKFIGCVLATAFVSLLSVNEVKAVDYNTALQLQEAASAQYYAIQEQQAAAIAAQQQAAMAQQQVIADTIAAQQAAELKARQDAAAAIAAQQQAVADAISAQQKAALEQQQAIADAIAAQQKAALEAASEEQKTILRAQQSAAEAATAIQAAGLVTPQVEVICDTNCAEKNAQLYAKSVPDFVLVDISEQRAVFYRNGMRVLADNCVTGDSKKGYHTTVGIHQIIFKDLNRTLHGSYGEAFVKYWMRFTNSGQGLHDAGWRRNFGSSIYISNGSHGCVNLPRETAATIYNNSYVGMHVIVEN